MSPSARRTRSKYGATGLNAAYVWLAMVVSRSSSLLDSRTEHRVHGRARRDPAMSALERECSIADASDELDVGVGQVGIESEVRYHTSDRVEWDLVHAHSLAGDLAERTCDLGIREASAKLDDTLAGAVEE